MLIFLGGVGKAAELLKIKASNDIRTPAYVSRFMPYQVVATLATVRSTARFRNLVRLAGASIV